MIIAVTLGLCSAGLDPCKLLDHTEKHSLPTASSGAVLSARYTVTFLLLYREIKVVLLAMVSFIGDQFVLLMAAASL